MLNIFDVLIVYLHIFLNFLPKFLNRVVVLLLRHEFSILPTYKLSDICFAKMFSQIVVCLFIF